MRTSIGKEANNLLESFGVDVAKFEIVNNLESAKKKISRFSFPVVLKIISQDAVHKTEKEGVVIVHNKEDFEQEFQKLVNNSEKNKIKLEGIQIQEFVEGVELIVGLKKDPTFGHVIMLGLGGIYVEALKDVTFRVCPINDKDAAKMILELRGKEILLSERKKLDLEKLRKVLLRISKIPQKKKGLTELDINPLIINKEDIKSVDVRIIYS